MGNNSRSYMYTYIGKEMVDYIANYLQNIRQRRVFPNVSPGYMRTLVPETAPQDGEHWDDIFRDVERVIMPGITHWQSPYMHAYFPALNSFPSLLGDMLADAIGCLGFTWASSPACTELETIVMDWLGKMIGLPSGFLHSNKQTMGGGVIQVTASDCTFISLLAARTEILRKFKNSGLEDMEVNSRLVAYCSDQAHSSVEKAGLIALVKMRFIECDDELSMRGDAIQEVIDKDREDGLIPFYVCATLGTTGACAFDNLKEIGPICERQGLWLHIDAAYAGTAFICPEFRKYMEGVEYANSFAFNPSKWMMGIRLATKFELLVRNDSRFEVAAKRILGMVVFRLKGENELTEILLKRLNRSGKVHMVPASLRGKYVIRFTVTSQYTEDCDIERDWKIISATATKVLHDDESTDEDVISPDDEVFEKEIPILRVPRVTPLKRKDYGISLLLSNVPMSPKLINGSFAALFDNNDVIVEFAKQITNTDFNGRPIRLSPRRRLKLKDSTKQKSLDTYKINRPLCNRQKYGSLDSKIEEILELSTLNDQTNGVCDIEDIRETDSEQNQSSEEEHPTVQVHISQFTESSNGNTSGSVAVNGSPQCCKHCGHVID
ncbi:hdc [Mytilus coruscus]|uniref:Histidine decarboxylase n=1 Tax=Mytilus coruscus TaxID=42192 RepID=A0A6J8EKN5_MYTCO|nr:hdc [Mytilus coruscus]